MARKSMIGRLAALSLSQSRMTTAAAMLYFYTGGESSERYSSSLLILFFIQGVGESGEEEEGEIFFPLLIVGVEVRRTPRRASFVPLFIRSTPPIISFQTH